MKKIIWIVMMAIVSMVSCSRSPQYRQTLSDAERLATIDPDKALKMLKGVELSDIKEDSLRALYAVVVASAHKAGENSMASDSLVRYAFEYYKGRNNDRFLQAGDLYALNRFWAGDGKGALELIDSLIRLPNVTDNRMIELLRSRIGIGGAEFDCNRNIEYIKKLQSLDKDSSYQIEYKYQLCENYQFAGHGDSALVIIDELIDYARLNHLGEAHFKYTYEKIGILEELRRYKESNDVADYVLEHAPYNSAIPYLRFWKALNYFNIGDYPQSCRELAIADSCAEGRTDVDNNYYESFAGPLREFLKYRRYGVIGISQLATLNNAQHERLNRIELTRLEAEQNALKQENRALSLKAQNERKTAIIIIVALVALLIGTVAILNIKKRRRKIIEAEERVETLQKMVDEMSSQRTPANGQEALRRVMLKQLGIIKMVAETPTEQNREMLRRISSVDSDTGESLVNWTNLYEIIDNLYSEFYTKLHNRYSDIISEKEEQVIVLMAAGFSAKEISVITSQSTASIYVRKSSVKKKLGVPEKEDVMRFLREELSH